MHDSLLLTLSVSLSLSIYQSKNVLLMTILALVLRNELVLWHGLFMFVIKVIL